MPHSTSAAPPRAVSRWMAAFPVVLSALVLAGWLGPSAWYSKAVSDRPAAWFLEITNAPGWRFEPQSIDKSAEALLAADALFYGQYTDPDGRLVRLFTARRFVENPYEVGLFVHTPDRCWTEAGWQIESADPEFVEVDVGPSRVGVERRVFVHPTGARELVYFFGLVGGQELPYRLDHNFGVGVRYRRAQLADKTGGTLRATDHRLWVRVWDSFRSRSQLFGPKEFVRISTPVVGGDAAGADALLRASLTRLLRSAPIGPDPGAAG